MTINTSLKAKSISYGGTRATSSIKYIVLHYTGNRTDTAKANANYFADGNTRAAGAHYFVDSTSVYQSIADNRIAYAVGGGRQSSSGGSMYGRITNANSLSIEMCSTGGAISSATIKNAVELTKKLMQKYSIDAANVYRHWDVNGKACPGWTGWTRSNAAKWEDFKSRLTVTEKKTASKSPTYTIGKKCTLLINLKLRTDAAKGNNAKKKSELSAYTQSCCVSGKSEAVLQSGTEITCKQVKTGEDGSTFVKSSSGWLLAWNAESKRVNIS